MAGSELSIIVSKDGSSATAAASLDLHNKWAISEWEAHTSLSSRKPSIKIYGPALDSIELDSNPSIFSYSTDSKQERLSVTMRLAKEFRLHGSYGTVDIAAKASESSALLEDASIDTLNVSSIEKSGTISAGDVKTLNLTQTDACMLRNELDIRADRSLQLRSISSGKITSNGEEYSVDYTELREVGCVMLSIEHPYESVNRNRALYEEE